MAVESIHLINTLKTLEVKYAGANRPETTDVIGLGFFGTNSLELGILPETDITMTMTRMTVHVPFYQGIITTQ